jgi:hypothetical protein
VRDTRSSLLSLSHTQVDAPWVHLGIEGLLSGRAFAVMTVEMDQAWGGPGDAPMRLSNVSSLDQLAWLARRHGYHTFLKIPCRSRLVPTPPTPPTPGKSSKGSMMRPPQQPAAKHNDMDPRWSAYYHPLAAPTRPYQPTGFTVGRDEWMKIQDVMLVDAAAIVEKVDAVSDAVDAANATSLATFLERRGREECRGI